MARSGQKRESAAGWTSDVDGNVLASKVWEPRASASKAPSKGFPGHAATSDPPPNCRVRRSPLVHCLHHPLGAEQMRSMLIMPHCH